MRTLFAALDVVSGTGGMQQYCRRVARTLAETEQRPTVVALRDTRADVPPAGVRHVPCGGSRRAMTAAFTAALVRDRPDNVVLGHVLLAPLVPIVRAVRPRARITLLAYGIDVWSPPPPWRALLVRRGIDRVVAISRTTATRMAAAYGLPAHRFRIVPPAVDAPASPAGPRVGEGRLLSVARLEPADRDKGVLAVLRALPAILSDFPAASYDVAGDGALRDEVEHTARGLGIASHVHLHGRVTAGELDALYRNADVFVLPSRKEGFGIVYLEAWSHGLAVVAGNRDAGTEVVAEGVTGLLADPGSTEEIAGAVKRLLGDEALRRTLGEAGRRLVADRFSHDTFREAFLGALRGGRP